MDYECKEINGALNYTIIIIDKPAEKELYLENS
jgi:hypothetical protein